ncbi:hypothetical protein BDW62DRAFT_182093 [Aspergillus aurantiobrunneus]
MHSEEYPREVEMTRSSRSTSTVGQCTAQGVLLCVSQEKRRAGSGKVKETRGSVRKFRTGNYNRSRSSVTSVNLPQSI